MVAIDKIRACNAQLTSSNAPQVAAFIGGTSGIGKITFEALVNLNFPVKVYIIGRKSSESRTKESFEQLRSSNPNAELVWLEADATLLASLKSAIDSIIAAETRLDLLFLSAGYAPFDGRHPTSEGLDRAFVLEYIGRMFAAIQLLPLLRASPGPRVISVLSGSLFDRSFNTEDPYLEQPGLFFGLNAQRQMGTMNSLVLDRLAAEEANKGISFIHSWPGSVNTGNATRHWSGPSLTSPFPLMGLLKPIIMILGMSTDEVGHRYIYLASSGTFGGHGPVCEDVKVKNTRGEERAGAFLLNNKCDATADDSAFNEVREKAQEKIWNRLMLDLKPYM